MKKLSTRMACGMLAAALGVSGLSGCGNLDGTQTVATVDGQEVTLGLASYILRTDQAEMEGYYRMLAQSYGMDGGEYWSTETEEGRTYGEDIKDNVMDTIKELYVMQEHAEDYGVSITEEEQAAIDEAAKTFMDSNDEETLEALAVSGDDVKTYMELYTIRQKMRDPMVADVDREVSDEEAAQTRVTFVEVSTEGTETDEDGNTVDLTDEEKAEKMDQAQQILDKVEAAEDPASADMDALAKEVDENLSAVERTFSSSGEGDEATDQAIKDAVADLEDGQVVPQVVEGEDAYYVVRLDLKFDEEATENEKKLIISDREDEQYDDLLAEWKDAADMEVKNGVWKKVKVTDSQPYELKQETAEDTQNTGDADSTEATGDAGNTDGTGNTGDTGSTDGADDAQTADGGETTDGE
ncbi:MAG TPA: hypothetical protein IAA57_02235 [Candidatus Pullilachnospira intestinigallinarum]|nr:hypothetical protein [Candidatus Pullilachnospira intestinigallinarum]